MDYNKMTSKVQKLTEKVNNFLNGGEILKARRALRVLDKNISKLKEMSKKSSYLTGSVAIYEEKFKSLCEILTEKVEENLYSMPL